MVDERARLRGIPRLFQRRGMRLRASPPALDEEGDLIKAG